MYNYFGFQGYRIFIKVGGNLTGPVLLLATETAHTFVDLLHDREHIIIMDAYYDHGIGPASAITVITTQEANSSSGIILPYFMEYNNQC